VCLSGHTGKNACSFEHPFFPPRFCRRRAPPSRVSDVFNSPEHPRGLLPTCSIPRRGVNSAGRPATPADPVPPAEHHDPRGGERRPRSKLGQAVGAMHPRLNSAGAASFARHTGLFRGCVRQSGGAGSGGKPDKSGGKLRVFARNYRCVVGTNGYVPLFVPKIV
jgi:hypothetical protein